MTSSYGSAYYAAPKKRPPVFLIVLGLLLAAGAVAIVYTETATVDAEPPAVAAEPQAAAETAELAPVAQPIDDRQQLLEENAHLRDQVENLQASLDGAEVDAGQLVELQQEVIRLRDELERYRTGLKNAVGELNAQRQKAPSRSSTPPSAKAPESRWVFAHDPYAVVNATGTDVSGSVHNVNDAPVRGYVVLTMTADGRQIMEKELLMEIPAKAVKEYDTLLTGNFPAGPSYKVRAEWRMSR